MISLPGEGNVESEAIGEGWRLQDLNKRLGYWYIGLPRWYSMVASLPGFVFLKQPVLDILMNAICHNCLLLSGFPGLTLFSLASSDSCSPGIVAMS